MILRIVKLRTDGARALGIGAGNQDITCIFDKGARNCGDLLRVSFP